VQKSQKQIPSALNVDLNPTADDEENVEISSMNSSSFLNQGVRNKKKSKEAKIIVSHTTKVRNNIIVSRTNGTRTNNMHTEIGSSEENSVNNSVKI
jgi:hypothetical protein